MTIQWKCKEKHPGCEAQAWQPYREMTESDAQHFIQNIAPNSTQFKYRIKPGKEKHDRTVPED